MIAKSTNRSRSLVLVVTLLCSAAPSRADNLKEVEAFFVHPLTEQVNALFPAELIKSAEAGRVETSVLKSRDAACLRSAQTILKSWLDRVPPWEDGVLKTVERDVRVVLRYKTEENRVLEMAITTGAEAILLNANGPKLSVAETKELLRILPFSIYPFFEVTASP